MINQWDITDKPEKLACGYSGLQGEVIIVNSIFFEMRCLGFVSTHLYGLNIFIKRIKY